MASPQNGDLPQESDRSMPSSSNGGQPPRPTSVRLTQLLKFSSIVVGIGGLALLLSDEITYKVLAPLVGHGRFVLGAAFVLAAATVLLMTREPRESRHTVGLRELLERLTNAKSEDGSRKKALVEGVLENIAFYSRTGKAHFRAYYLFRVPILIAAALIPVLGLSLSTDAAKYVTASLGAFITILEGMLQLGRFHENWLERVNTRGALIQETKLFLVGAAPYVQEDAADREELFVARTEAINAQEVRKWLSIRQQVASDDSRQLDRRRSESLAHDPTDTATHTDTSAAHRPGAARRE